VGVIGYFAPRTMGVGYDNIEQIIGGHMTLSVLGTLCTLKFLSWVIALGSGTSGGTLAPLFTIGGGLGAALGALAAAVAPQLGIDVRIAALVGMAAMFAGASRALLASVVFAFETTRQPIGLLPLLGGCTSAFLMSFLLMRHSIMTEKIARRGVRVIGEYTSDYLSQRSVGERALRRVITLRANDTLESVRSWLSSGAQGTEHQGFPVLDQAGQLIGVLTRKDLHGQDLPGQRLHELVRRRPVVIHEDSSLRDAANLMARERIGRLPVLSRSLPQRVVGIVTRSDLVEAHVQRLDEHEHARRTRRGLRRAT
jgi:CIC family chloride channel protein